ncbi:HYC_CC_PP family protein [Pedobacter cryoconitis]|uniref:Uncharacterized protein n=1 Tax=Pedobacter cryoconitis TaxID=188932 RepID=A0A327T5H3_9SPHI|nr:hypothetical protein [Pedobacter cryoconitis]RAJ33017.1 hypothetical protein LY11_01707 [Pedobacter cryoconitis]
MKKALSILLLLLYTTASFGLGVKQFYCCGQLRSISFTIQQDVNEKCSKDMDKEQCCEIQLSSLEVKDIHLLSSQSDNQVKHFNNLFLSAFRNYHPAPSFDGVERIPIASSTNAPLLHGGVPIYMFNCTYRI